MKDQRWFDDNRPKNDYGIIDKSHLLSMIQDLRQMVEEERHMRDQLCQMYERQLAIQDAEIKRLQNDLARAKYEPSGPPEGHEIGGWTNHGGGPSSDYPF